VTNLNAMSALVLAVLLCCPAAHAQQEDGSGWGRMTEVNVDAEGKVLRIDFSKDIVNPGNCEGGDFYIRELDGSAASEQFVRVVLAAHLANRKVKFWIVGCTKSKWWGKTRPQIIDIYVGD
jgi:hypothetical protein